LAFVQGHFSFLSPRGSRLSCPFLFLVTPYPGLFTPPFFSLRILRCLTDLVSVPDLEGMTPVFSSILARKGTPPLHYFSLFSPPPRLTRSDFPVFSRCPVSPFSRLFLQGRFTCVSPFHVSLFRPLPVLTTFGWDQIRSVLFSLRISTDCPFLFFLVPLRPPLWADFAFFPPQGLLTRSDQSFSFFFPSACPKVPFFFLDNV